MEIKSLRGMNDIFLPDIYLWQKIEETLRKVSHNYGYYEMRTPLLESTLLFKRGVGEGSDMVQKEMYSFEDKSGENISLRPEGTASVVRAVVEHNLLRENPVSKIYYIGPMFRHERPQKGRFRQFNQFGIELFGVTEATADVEVIALAQSVLEQLGLGKHIKLHLTSIGCSDSNCRPKYQKALTTELLKYEKDLPEEFRPRIHSNPMRVFDQKDEKSKFIAQKLPVFGKNHLCENCKKHIEQVEQGLKDLNIKYFYDESIVRGIDYYNRTAFEFITTELGTQGTVCGGGRYDGLVKSFGGPEAPGIGFGMGIERVAMLVQQLNPVQMPTTDLALIYADDAGKKYCLAKANELRGKGYCVEVDLQGRSMKAQMKMADKARSIYSIIVGETEIKNNKLTLKNMSQRTQKEINMSELELELKK